MSRVPEPAKCRCGDHYLFEQCPKRAKQKKLPGTRALRTLQRRYPHVYQEADAGKS